MTQRLPLVLLFVLLSCSSGESQDTAPSPAADGGPIPATFAADIDAALNAASTVELFALHPDEAEGDADAQRFHGFVVLGQVAADAALGKEVLHRIAEGVRIKSSQAKCWEPRHGVRVVSEDGTSTDLVICYECHYVHVHLGDVERQGFTTGNAVEPAVSGLFTKAGLAIHGQ